jgi:hypothetical protein
MPKFDSRGAYILIYLSYIIALALLPAFATILLFDNRISLMGIEGCSLITTTEGTNTPMNASLAAPRRVEEIAPLVGRL